MSVPFNEFIVKVASRCNLNCDYCYEYNLGDHSWRSQPKFISLAVAKQAGRRIREHAERHHLQRVSILFHGGEPLLAGADHMRDLVTAFRNELEPEVRISFGIQTNGTLLTSELLGLLEQEKFGVGISVDGPPKVHDIHRLDLAGRGSGKDVEKALNLLHGRDCFSGILCVIDVRSDPLEVWDYLASHNPPMVDFLLPHGTWDRKPFLKDDTEKAPYADWLIQIFDRWFNGDRSHIRIRYFEEIIRHSLGGSGGLESLGLEPAALLVIAANGDYEGVDTLKAVLPGAHILGMNVKTQSLDDVLEHPKVVFRQSGSSVLSNQCKACKYLDTCGGGYITHRYSETNSFANPSVYCSDLYKLIESIRCRLLKEVRVNVV